MTTMIEEVGNHLEGGGDYGLDHDDESSIPEMFRTSSGLLDSLDKLTNEIKADLDEDSVTGSNESSSNDDEDFYWSDEDNYDSGENKLFSMMDELVNELMIELKDDKNDVLSKDNKTVVDGENDENILNKGDQIVDEIGKDDHQTAAESDDDVQPSVVSASSEEGASSTSNMNASQPIDDPVEKHVKLHEHVRTLLGQVTEMTDAMNAMKKTKAVKNEYNDRISANIQRKIEHGDYNADRLEHLMGAIATYSKFREAKINAIPSLASPTQTSSAAKVKNKKRRKRTNKHKRRRSKSFVQTQQSLLILSDSLIALDEKLSRERH